MAGCPRGLQRVYDLAASDLGRCDGYTFAFERVSEVNQQPVAVGALVHRQLHDLPAANIASTPNVARRRGRRLRRRRWSGHPTRA